MRITESKLRQIIRESILLTEAVTLEEAESSVKKRIMKMSKGAIWEMEQSGKLSQFDLDEEQLAWLREWAPQLITHALTKGLINISLGDSWSSDIDQDYQGDALKWTYNQLVDRVKDNNPDVLKRRFENAIRQVAEISKKPAGKRIPINWEISSIIGDINSSWLWTRILNTRTANYRSTIENYYQMLRFIEPAEKRNIHLVNDINELTSLVTDATPRYQEHAENRKNDPESISNGTEVLLDDDSWWIGAIHNCEAAHFHAKCWGPERRLTLWCTAAPGVGCKFFNNYYRTDDPLIIFKDKHNQVGYQFSFSSKQFMDVGDKFVGPEKKAELTGLLASVENKIKPSYIYIHNAISDY